jgi:hypothetical protein
MSSAAILRKMPLGKRLHPIDKAEADKMVAEGLAKVLHSNLYEEKVASPSVMVEDAPEPVYATKVMTPVAPKPSKAKEKA